MTAHLYDTLDPDRFGAGRLTKARAQAISAGACARVARDHGVEDRLRGRAPVGARGRNVEVLLESDHALADVLEALIGAAYLHHGLEQVAPALVTAFDRELEAALEFQQNHKEMLQERLARRGETVAYRVVAEDGPSHSPSYEVVAEVDGQELGRGSGRSKKEAEQAAARAALAGEEAAA